MSIQPGVPEQAAYTWRHLTAHDLPTWKVLTDIQTRGNTVVTAGNVRDFRLVVLFGESGGILTESNKIAVEARLHFEDNVFKIPCQTRAAFSRSQTYVRSNLGGV
jgi:hypothetical protein